MARINLIVCDLCREQIDNEDGGKFKIGLEGPEFSMLGEICSTCYEALLARLKSEKSPSTVKASKGSPVKQALVTPDVPIDDELSYADPNQVPVGPSVEEKADRAATKELLEDELNVVPSRFDKRKANKIVEKNKDACPHHFKTWQDGKVICAAAPNGVDGPLNSFRGCGKILITSEY